jgi:hypothetical protein
MDASERQVATPLPATAACANCGEIVKQNTPTCTQPDYWVHANGSRECWSSLEPGRGKFDTEVVWRINGRE